MAKSIIADASKVFEDNGKLVKKLASIKPEGTPFELNDSIFNNSIALVYAFLHAPAKVLDKAFEGISGKIVKLMYDTVMAPFRSVVFMLNPLNLLNLFKSILFMFVKCLPQKILNEIKFIFTTVAGFFSATIKAIRGQKKIDSLKKRMVLTESRAKHFEIKIWDWFKGAIGSIVEKAKNVAAGILKFGFSIIEKGFKTIFEPYIKCLSENNPFKDEMRMVNMSNPIFSTFTATLAVGGMAVGGVLGPAIMLFALALTLVGVSCFVFTAASYVSLLGKPETLKEIIESAYQK